MGMTRIRLTCPDCGEKEVPADEVGLALSEARPQWNTLGWLCPECCCFVRTKANPFVLVALARLINDGTIVTEHIPDEVTEPHDGGPLDLDYAIDLHNDLERFGT